jgi:macrolide-specific efflux system membrane fusion protein
MRRFCVLLAVVSLFSASWFATAQDPRPPRARPGAKAEPANVVQPSGADALQMNLVVVTLIEPVEVPARDVGQLQSINVKEGQLVTEGDLVAQIDDKDVQLARNKAKIEADIAREEAANDKKVRTAKKTSEVAASELARAKESIEKYRDAVPAAELDRLKLAAEKAVIDIEQAEHELRAAKLALQLKENEHDLAEHNVAKRKILAPLSGMVVEIYKHGGEWVQPGDKVVRVVRLDRLRVEAFLTRQDVEAQGELVGRSVNLTVTIAGKPQDFTGKVVHVHPEINPLSGKVRVWAEVDNRDLRLRPGMQGTLTVSPAAESVAVKS